MGKKRNKNKINPFYKIIIVFLSTIVFLIFISTIFRVTHILSRNEESKQYRKSFTIDVRNACGEKGVARSFTNMLVKADFDVINRGNLAKRTKMSYIVYKEGLPRRKVSLISSITGIDSTIIDSMGKYLFDVTIILGDDYKEKASLFIRRYSGQKDN